MSEIDITLFVNELQRRQVTISDASGSFPQTIIDAVVCVGIEHIGDKPIYFVQVGQTDNDTGETKDVLKRPNLQQYIRRGWALELNLAPRMPSWKIVPRTTGKWVPLALIENS